MRLTELNNARFEEFNKGKEQAKQELNSIKERVWKKQRFTLTRRKKQMKEVEPPTTFEIYMTNLNSRQSSLQQQTPQSKQPRRGATSYSFNTPLNLRNPLMDYSFQLALAST